MSPAELDRIIGWIGRFRRPPHLYEVAGAASWSLQERLLEPDDIHRLMRALAPRRATTQERQEVA